MPSKIIFFLQLFISAFFLVYRKIDSWPQALPLAFTKGKLPKNVKCDGFLTEELSTKRKNLEKFSIVLSLGLVEIGQN